MNLAAAIAKLHHAELDLARQLEKAAHTHALDADMAHHGPVLARQARHHATALDDYVGSTTPGEPGPLSRAVESIREISSHVLGHEQHAGALLLDDLVELHRAAVDAEVWWWIVRQGALVHRDQHLYELFERFHEHTWNHVRWLKTKIKEAAPQVLA